MLSLMVKDFPKHLSQKAKVFLKQNLGRRTESITDN